MRICPNCQTENEENVRFCKECGFNFTNEEVEEAVVASEPAEVKPEIETFESEEIPTVEKNIVIPSASETKNKKTPWLIGAVIVLLATIVGGLIFFFIWNQPQRTIIKTADSVISEVKTKTTASSEVAKKKKTTTTSSTETTTKDSKKTSDKEDLTKYDATIKKAKELTLDEKFKESELKLAEIPVSDLAKEEFKSVREAVDDLSKKNTAGIEAAKKNKGKQTEKAVEPTPAAPAPSTAGSSFVGDYAKWANSYVFYYNQNGQKQGTLAIAANGGVTQTNNDGTQFFGFATVTGSAGSILSYNTNDMYPASQPQSKSINPNVSITIQWDNGGGTQVLYGYLSYSSRLVLTDGVAKGSGVNEVWISY
ncbi:cytoskeletal protein RodZ [Enterococcus sp. PF1-24]|uniref:zinc ribbon domain-containing protein n=1 Tax=unclassified Enterococcus TaxID=2608891 RepID=UPI002473F231|nr:MULTISPECIES: zinc ribbon domain-containing protein [unclassified Enterococcus]MDH6364114.1 cytoskeletal protein RodZ [Enterococcus sp. PFB1-1]MDH6401215.1 cytoskeletal protein RodZ [Enterococcus sp. PF1-24]